MIRSNQEGSIIGAVLAVCLVLGSSCTRHDAQQLPFPNNIPIARREAYSGIREASQWKNPYLVVRPRGVEILSVESLVAPENLQTVLGALPSTAWPYGRIVAVQELGIRSGNDDQMIAEVLEEVLATLKRLDVEVSRWPSA